MPKMARRNASLECCRAPPTMPARQRARDSRKLSRKRSSRTGAAHAAVAGAWQLASSLTCQRCCTDAPCSSSHPKASRPSRWSPSDDDLQLSSYRPRAWFPASETLITHRPVKSRRALSAFPLGPSVWQRKRTFLLRTRDPISILTLRERVRGPVDTDRRREYVQRQERANAHQIKRTTAMHAHSLPAMSVLERSRFPPCHVPAAARPKHSHRAGLCERRVRPADRAQTVQTFVGGWPGTRPLSEGPSLLFDAASSASGQVETGSLEPESRALSSFASQNGEQQIGFRRLRPLTMPCSCQKQVPWPCTGSKGLPIGSTVPSEARLASSSRTAWRPRVASVRCPWDVPTCGHARLRRAVRPWKSARSRRRSVELEPRFSPWASS